MKVQNKERMINILVNVIDDISRKVPISTTRDTVLMGVPHLHAIIMNLEIVKLLIEEDTEDVSCKNI